MHERLYLIVKHGALVSAILVLLANCTNIFVYRHAVLLIIQTLGLGFSIGLDFYLNYSMIRRALAIIAVPVNRDLAHARAIQIAHTEHRKKLKHKLLTVFSLTLAVNCSNLAVYTMGELYFPQYYVEIFCMCGAELIFYISLNCMIALHS